MINHVDILDPVQVEITDASLKINNFKTISLNEGTSSLELFVGDKNYKVLAFSVAVELNFKDTLELIHLLANKVGGLYDYDNTEYKLSEIYYEKEEDKVYARWEES